MHEPILFILLLIVAVAAVYILKVILCSLSQPIRKFIDKLEAVPEDEAKLRSPIEEKESPYLRQQIQAITGDRSPRSSILILPRASKLRK